MLGQMLGDCDRAAGDAQGFGGCFVMELVGVLEKATGAPSRCLKAESGRSFPSELAESLYPKLYKASGPIRMSLFIPSHIKHQEQSGCTQRRRRNFRRAFLPAMALSDRQQRWEGRIRGDAGTKQEGSSQEISCVVLLLLLFRVKQVISRLIQ